MIIWTKDNLSSKLKGKFLNRVLTNFQNDEKAVVCFGNT